MMYTLPVLPEENEVSLIVKGDNSPGSELGIVREQGCQHASYNMAHTTSEVVQHHLRVTCYCTRVSLHSNMTTVHNDTHCSL